MSDPKAIVAAAAQDIEVLKAAWNTANFYAEYVVFTITMKANTINTMNNLHSRLETGMVLRNKLLRWQKAIYFYGVPEQPLSPTSVEAIVGHMYNDAFRQMVLDSFDLFATLDDVPNASDVYACLNHYIAILQKRWNGFPTFCIQETERKAFLQTARDRLIQDINSLC